MPVIPWQALLIVPGLMLGAFVFAGPADNPAGAAIPQSQTQPADMQAQAKRLYFEGESYLREASANQKYGRAIEKYRAAAGLGYDKAEERLNWLQSYLPNEPGLQARYRRELVKAKNSGREQVKAQYLVGEMCEFGIGVDADFKRALFWYKKAAGNESGEAQNRLGELYSQGKIGQQESVNEEQALRWIQAAAHNGQPDAQFKLAEKYLNGEQLPENQAEAFSWFKRAAGNGLAKAQMQTGFMLKEGKGTERNYEQALFWFEKAAAQDAEGAEEQVDKLNYILDEIFLQNFE